MEEENALVALSNAERTTKHWNTLQFIGVLKKVENLTSACGLNARHMPWARLAYSHCSECGTVACQPIERALIALIYADFIGAILVLIKQHNPKCANATKKSLPLDASDWSIRLTYSVEHSPFSWTPNLPFNIPHTWPALSFAKKLAKEQHLFMHCTFRCFSSGRSDASEAKFDCVLYALWAGELDLTWTKR